MKRFITIFALAMFVMAPAAMAQNSYGWTISDSATDARSNSGTNAGVATLYLWLDCVTADGVAAAEFDVAGPGGAPLAFTQMNGFLNAGSPGALLLATPCTMGPVVAGSFLFVPIPGDICITASAANGKNVSVDCTNFLEWDNNTIGYQETLGGTAACAEELCTIVSVEDSSWGSVKSLYR